LHHLGTRLETDPDADSTAVPPRFLTVVSPQIPKTRSRMPLSLKIPADTIQAKRPSRVARYKSVTGREILRRMVCGA